jgi:hypothetical protein
MRRLFFVVLTLILTFIPSFGAVAQSGYSPGAGISAPTPGSPLKGLVTIEGTTTLDGFLSWEITFNYASDTTGSWFLIAEGNQAITQGELTQWDTNTITDGDYNFRLTIFLEGGRREHFVVNNLRVRNYSPIETVTPTPTLTPTPYTETPRPSLTATITQPPSETPIPDTPTPLPTNPVIITQNDITNSLTRGAAGAAAAFVLVGLYLSIKRIFRK